ncbi:hypothetical protein MKX47_07310 [Solibacillus sp. FSL R7-0668]|uniref:hypothetical protein n=1 Tax=Solibacillus sp. FSL R7-0668 TaxID=2921688 RepID=UPI0030FD0D66
MMFTVYQQQRVINDYRSLLFEELEKLNTQFERFLVFHKESEKYDEKERNEKLQQLRTTFSDFFYYTGDILKVESEIRENYLITYQQTKFDLSKLLDSYIAAATAEERNRIYKEINELYSVYNEFLDSSEV